MNAQFFTTTFHQYLAQTGRQGHDYIRDAVANLDHAQLFADDAASVVAEQVALKPPIFKSAPTLQVELVRQKDGEFYHETVRVTFTIPVAGEVAMLQARPRDWHANRGVPNAAIAEEAVRLSFDFEPSSFTTGNVMHQYRAARGMLDEVERAHVDACDQIAQGTRSLIDQFIKSRRERVRLMESVQREIEAALQES